MSLFHLYAAYAIMPTHVLRPIHVGWMLLLCFLLFPVAPRFRHRVRWWDCVAALRRRRRSSTCSSAATISRARDTRPTAGTRFFGVALILLVLEAARRTSGWIMPFAICAVPRLCVGRPVAAAAVDALRQGHRRIVGHMYMTLEGIFGVAIDVSSSLIILFTIYGAFLQFSGAGKFFIDFSFAAMGGKPSGAGRTVVLASFLLGGPSGSGVATTVTLGTSPIRCWSRPGTARTRRAGCSRRAAWARSSRRRCWARRPS